MLNVNSANGVYLSVLGNYRDFWGWRYSTKFHWGRHRRKVQPLTFSYTIFDRKCTPFRLPSIDDPFTWLVKNFTFPSTTVNDCIMNMNKAQNQKVFSTTSQPSKAFFSPFGPLYRPKWLISLPFQIPETWKWYLPSGGASPIIHYREPAPTPSAGTFQKQASCMFDWVILVSCDGV